MQRTPNIVLLVPTAFASLLASLVITWLVWECNIPGRAFQCKDDGFSVGFWMGADTHRSAGDIILPGWTWEKLDRVNNIYKLACLAIWLGASFGSFRLLRSVLRE